MADDNKLKAAIQLGKTLATPAGIKLKDGSTLTQDMFDKSAKNGLPFTDMKTMANYYNEWSRKIPQGGQTFPYIRHYGSGSNIPGGDFEILKAKYANDPSVQAILARNIAKPGEVPLYGADDGDALKSIIARDAGLRDLITKN